MGMSIPMVQKLACFVNQEESEKLLLLNGRKFITSNDQRVLTS
jgi:hypothetical protein